MRARRRANRPAAPSWPDHYPAQQVCADREPHDSRQRVRQRIVVGAAALLATPLGRLHREVRTRHREANKGYSRTRRTYERVCHAHTMTLPLLSPPAFHSFLPIPFPMTLCCRCVVTSRCLILVDMQACATGGRRIGAQRCSSPWRARGLPASACLRSPERRHHLSGSRKTRPWGVAIFRLMWRDCRFSVCLSTSPRLSHSHRLEEAWQSQSISSHSLLHC